MMQQSETTEGPGPMSARPSSVPRACFQPEGRGIVDSARTGLYVVRASDGELFERLDRREPCHVLAPRQIGKSSLRVRTQERLRARGVLCASVDLTSIGSGASADEWYFSVASAIAEELALSEDLDAFWGRNRRVSPVRRFRQFLHEVLLGDEDGPPIVVFLDEIDVTLSLPFPRDDFFGVIRATHQARAADPRWERLTFCLIGVAAPLDLVADPERTPFNTSFAVRLDDFSRNEARTFLSGLALAGGDAEHVLDAVLDWTSGHPALTQRLCYWLTRQSADEREARPAERVAALVRRLFLSSGRIDDPILLDAERRFAGDRPDARIPVMLHLYQRLLDGEQVPVDGNNSRQFGLRIAGLAAERREAGVMVLRVRNRIFAEVFNRAWVEEKLARRFLTEPLQIWKDSGKKSDHVLRGGALEIALAWAKGRDDITPDERDFLQASQAVSSAEQQERQQAELDRSYRERAEQQVRAQRRLVTLLVASVVLVATSLVIAIVNYQAAQTALEQESQRREAELKATALLHERANEVRLRALEQERWEAERALDEAERAREEAESAAQAMRTAADSTRRAADEARARASKSAFSAWRAQQLLTTARQKADDAAALEIRAHNAAAAVKSAARKLRDVDEASLAVAAQAPAESVLGSVQSTLTAERAITARFQEDLRRKTAEADEAKTEVTRLQELVAQLNDALDAGAKMRRDRPLPAPPSPERTASPASSSASPGGRASPSASPREPASPSDAPSATPDAGAPPDAPPAGGKAPVAEPDIYD